MSTPFGKAQEVVKNEVYAIKTFVGVGCGCGNLSHVGLRNRFLSCLDCKGEAEAGKAGKLDDLVRLDEFTTAAMAQEERSYVASVQRDEVRSFDIDTTVTVIKLPSGALVLHSPTRLTPELRREVKALGDNVVAIIAPNLQHWLGVVSWAAEFKEAKVFVAPPAMGEDLIDKLVAPDGEDKKEEQQDSDDASSHQYVARDRIEVLSTERSTLSVSGLTGVPEDDTCLAYQLMEGAPLMLNEVAFLHAASKTLILADGFYTGHAAEQAPPNPFSRLWFKVTKSHWSACELPIYRTSRVVSSGEPEKLLACLRTLVDDWAPAAIVAAHGNRLPFRGSETQSAGEAWIESWSVVLPKAGKSL